MSEAYAIVLYHLAKKQELRDGKLARIKAENKRAMLREKIRPYVPGRIYTKV